jgi:hypothetical protein
MRLVLTEVLRRVELKTTSPPPAERTRVSGVIQQPKRGARSTLISHRK